MHEEHSSGCSSSTSHGDHAMGGHAHATVTATKRAPGGQAVTLAVTGVGAPTAADASPAAPAGTGCDTGCAAAVTALPLPQRIYFLWTARTLAELQLLGAPLLRALTPLSLSGKAGDIGRKGSSSCDSCDSGSGRGWLQAALHYTGFEQEVGEKGERGNGDGAAALSPKPSSDSSSARKPAPAPLLVPHPATASPLLFAVCITLTFLGGFAGMIAANRYPAMQVVKHDNDGNYSVVGPPVLPAKVYCLYLCTAR